MFPHRPPETRRHGSIEKHPTDALPALRGIDHDVVKYAGRSAKRQVVISTDARVAITDHLALSPGDEHDDVPLLELLSQTRRIPAPSEVS